MTNENGVEDGPRPTFEAVGHEGSPRVNDDAAPGGAGAGSTVATEPAEPAEPAEPTQAEPTVDLDAIAADLADVEVALARLANGSYWTDEVTGAPLPEELLESAPIARRLPGG